MRTARYSECAPIGYAGLIDHQIMKIVILALLVLATAGAVAAQTGRPAVAAAKDQAYRSSAAYAEIALKRAEVEAELESLLVEYTDEFPKVKELKFSMTRIDVEAARLTTIKPADRDRATAALGKLMVRKVEAELELWKVSQDLADAHPEVKKAKKKVEIFEKAIKEILG